MSRSWSWRPCRNRRSGDRAMVEAVYVEGLSVRARQPEDGHPLRLLPPPAPAGDQPARRHLSTTFPGVLKKARLAKPIRRVL